MTARLLATALAALLLAPASAVAGRHHDQELPLGSPRLQESRSSRALAPGVTYTRIVRGELSSRAAWRVDAAFLADRDAAEELARRLRAAGFDAEVQRIADRAPDDPARGPLGYLVRTGRFATEAEAQARQAALTGAGFTGARVVFTEEDGGRTTGPWVVPVLEVEPWRVDARLATDVVPERELLTSLAGRSGSIAAINGGYFVIGEADGTPGDLAGVSVLDGDLASEAVDGRSSLLLGRREARIASVETRSVVVARDGASREVDGLNRKPGLIRGCGGDGGDLPTELPKHDFTCTDASELIHFTPLFGAASAPGEGAEAALDARGRVVELREGRGGAIPAPGSVLAGTGEAADWLRAHAREGKRLVIRDALLADGAPLRSGGALDVVNGGPRLLRRGAPDITAFAEGFHWAEDPGFYYRFGVRRNPRTLAGIDRRGGLRLVAVDGRRPGYSVGASFAESAAILRALGAREGLNLDGGGSTGITLGSTLVTRPSDATGERPIGDALVISR